VLTVRELARYLKVHTSTIYRLLKRHELPAFTVGSDWRFHVEAIDRWLLESGQVLREAQAAEKKTPAHTPPPDLHEGDHRAWASAQARALREHRAEALDWENLATEIEALGLKRKPSGSASGSERTRESGTSARKGAR